MTKQNQANGDEDESENKRRIPRWLSTGLWIAGWILGLAIVVVGLFCISRFLDTRVSDPIQFITGNLLNVLLFVVILFQTYIYRRQTRIMGVAYDPRLRIASVRAEDFQARKRPVFIISIVNEGLTDARDVRLQMRVRLDADRKLKWIRDQVVTIPANGKENYFIRSGEWLNQFDLLRFDIDPSPLKVEGYFSYGDHRTEFCYHYLPWDGQRPEGIAQFIPCDFDPGLNTPLVIQPAHHAHTSDEVILTQEQVIPNNKQENERGSEGGEQ